jgi:hypothetical protein
MAATTTGMAPPAIQNARLCPAIATAEIAATRPPRLAVPNSRIPNAAITMTANRWRRTRKAPIRKQPARCTWTSPGLR